MRSRPRTIGAAALLVAILAADTAAQTDGQHDAVQPAPPASAADDLVRLRGRARAALDSALLAEDNRHKQAFAREAEAAAAGALAIDGRDLETRYMHAAALGIRASKAGIREKVRLGNRVYEEANAILAEDPGHAGAHLLLGSVNAAVMRMDRATRFIVGKLTGSEALRVASWQQAEQHFRALLERDPQSPAGHYELSRVLWDTGRREEASHHLDTALAVAGTDAVTLYYRNKALRAATGDR